MEWDKEDEDDEDNSAMSGSIKGNWTIAKKNMGDKDQFEERTDEDQEDAENLENKTVGLSEKTGFCSTFVLLFASDFSDRKSNAPSGRSYETQATCREESCVTTKTCKVVCHFASTAYA